MLSGKKISDIITVTVGCGFETVCVLQALTLVLIVGCQNYTCIYDIFMESQGASSLYFLSFWKSRY